jgi:hypothetical protein
MRGKDTKFFAYNMSICFLSLVFFVFSFVFRPFIRIFAVVFAHVPCYEGGKSAIIEDENR